MFFSSRMNSNNNEVPTTPEKEDTKFVEAHSELNSRQSINQDWQGDRSLVECMQYMLTNQIGCDVSFIVGPEKVEVRAHRLILIARSPVFFKKLRPSSEEFRSKMTISDTSVDTFLRFVRYLYTDEASFDLETATSLLPVARRFKVNRLVQLCLCLLHDGVDCDNVCILLDEAIQSHALQMRDRAMVIINKSTRICLKSRAFRNIGPDAFDYILKSNELNISEEELYECSLEWATTQCQKKQLETTDGNLRQQLGNSLYRIRFTLMPKEYFQYKIEKSKILTGEEKDEIKEYITDRNFRKENFKFDKNLRTVSKYFRLLRFIQLDTKLKEHTGRPDAIMFETSKPVWFHGVIVYGSFIEQSINIHVKITDARLTIVRELGQTFKSVESEAMHDVLLPTPFETVPGARYNVVVTIVGKFRHLFRGIAGKRSLNFKDSEITFYESGCSSNGTTVTEGQIPGFLLS